MLIDFRERGRERETGRETPMSKRKISVRSPLARTPAGTEPATQARVPTGHHPTTLQFTGPSSRQLSHTGQGRLWLLDYPLLPLLLSLERKLEPCSPNGLAAGWGELISSCIRSFNKYLLGTNYMPGVLLSPVSQTSVNSYPRGQSNGGRETVKINILKAVGAHGEDVRKGGRTCCGGLRFTG